MPTIFDAIDLYQKLALHEVSHAGSSEKKVSGKFNGRRFESIVTDGADKESIELSSRGLNHFMLNASPEGISLGTARKRLKDRIVAHVQEVYRDKSADDVKEAVEKVLTKHLNDIPERLVVAIRQKIAPDPVKSEHVQPVMEKIEKSLHGKQDINVQVTAAEFDSMADKRVYEHVKIHKLFSGYCSRTVEHLREFFIADIQRSYIDLDSLKKISDLESAIKQESDPRKKSVYQKQLGIAQAKFEILLEEVAEFRKKFYKLESITRRRWSTDIFATSTDEEVSPDIKAVYQAGKSVEAFRCESVHLAQLGQIKKDHESVKNHPKVVVSGGGPIGLLTTIKQYEAGADVTLLEKRSTEYNRSQILRLDPQWVSELRYYLGNQFERLFLSGQHGAIKPDGSAHIQVAALETALHDRLLELISYIDNGQSAPGIKRLAAHSVVDVSPPASPDGRYVINTQYDRAYDKQYVVGKSTPTKGLEKIEADILICAEGKNSSTREQFFNHGPVTYEKTYGVASWSGSPVDNSKQDTFEKIAGTFTVTPEFKAKCVAITQKELEAIKNEVGDRVLPSSRIQDMTLEQLFLSVTTLFQSVLHGVADNNTLSTRHFENYKTAYIGMEIPKPIHDFFVENDRFIDEHVGDKLTDEQKIRIKSTYRKAWFQSVADIGQKDQPNLTEKLKLDINMMDSKFTSTFPSSIDKNTSNIAVIIGPDDETQLVVFTAGDASTSPHFMTASGLTGGREETESQAEYTHKIAMLDDPLNAKALISSQESATKKQEKASNYVITQGEAGPDGLSPLLPISINGILEANSINSLQQAMAKPTQDIQVTAGSAENIFNVEIKGTQRFILTVLEDGVIQAENTAVQPSVKEYHETFNNFKLTHVR